MGKAAGAPGRGFQIEVIERYGQRSHIAKRGAQLGSQRRFSAARQAN
jgi:hypothetical protein